MKRIFTSLIFAAVGLASLGGPVLAQTVPQVSAINSADAFLDIPFGIPGPVNYYASPLQLRSFVLGQNSQHLASPTLTTTTTVCGGSTATVNGTDTSGQIAEGSSASTSCVVTFARAYSTAPACFVSIDNVADTALKCSASTTALTITKSSAASEKINYLVLGLVGG